MNRVKLKIRPAIISDAEQMAALFMKAWHISLKAFAPNGFLDQFKYEDLKQKYMERTVDPKLIYFVADHNGDIVGMVGARDNRLESLSYQKEIRAMYIDPDFQRQGIGTLLFDRILSELKKQKVESLMLWCIKANDAACSFYEKHGGKRIENINPPKEYSAMPHVVYTWQLLDQLFKIG